MQNLFIERSKVRKSDHTFFPEGIQVKGAPDPVAREVYRGLVCLRKILLKPTDSVPQQDCECQKLKSGCEN